MDGTGSLGRLRAVRDRPRAGFLGTCGEVGLQTEYVEADTRQLIETGLVPSGGRKKFGGVLGVEVDQLGLDLGIQENGLRGDDESGELVLLRLVGERGLTDVEEVKASAARRVRSLDYAGRAPGSLGQHYATWRGVIAAICSPARSSARSSS